MNAPKVIPLKWSMSMNRITALVLCEWKHHLIILPILVMLMCLFRVFSFVIENSIAHIGSSWTFHSHFHQFFFCKMDLWLALSLSLSLIEKKKAKRLAIGQSTCREFYRIVNKCKFNLIRHLIDYNWPQHSDTKRIFNSHPAHQTEISHCKCVAHVYHMRRPK